MQSHYVADSERGRSSMSQHSLIPAAHDSRPKRPRTRLIMEGGHDSIVLV